MINIFKKFNLVILCILIPSFLFSNQPKNQNKNVKINADEVIRDANNPHLILDGNVVIKNEGVVIYADELDYFPDTKTAYSEGTIRVRNELTNYLKGEKAQYNIESSTGTMQNGKTLTVPWIIRGERMNKISKDIAIVYKAIITSCDYEKPDYYFKTSKSVIYFDNKIVSHNVVLFIRGVPIFYFPIFVQSLKKRKLKITMAVGHSSEDGFYAKTKVEYSFDDQNKIHLLIDKYEHRGWGLGAQYDYRNKDINNGSIFLYGIDDTVDDVMKRTFRMNHSQKLSQRWRSYTSINYQNDESFDNDLMYTPLGKQRVKSNINSYTSLNYVGNMYSMTAVWDMEQDWDNEKKSYTKTKESLPNLTLDTYQNKFFVNKLYYQTGFNFLNSFNKTNDTYYGTGSTYFNLTRAFPLTKNITLTPKTGIRQNFTNTPNKKGFYEEDHLAKWENSIGLNNRLTRDIDLNFTYNYIAGLFDVKETIYSNNLASSLNTYFLNNNLRLTSSISYDFNTDVDSTVKRFSPLVNDLRWRLGKKVNYYAKQQYNFSKKRTEMFQNILYFFPTAKWSFSTNVVSMEKNDLMLDVISTIKYRPNLKWRFDFSIRNNYDLLYNEIKDVRDKVLGVYRDLHCWEMRFMIIDRNESIIKDNKTYDKTYREYWITFNTKAMPGQQISFYRDDRNDYYTKPYTWDLRGEAATT